MMMTMPINFVSLVHKLYLTLYGGEVSVLSTLVRSVGKAVDTKFDTRLYRRQSTHERPPVHSPPFLYVTYIQAGNIDTSSAASNT